MTIQEISRYDYLRQRLEKLNNALIALQTKAENCTTTLNGMPRGGSADDKVSFYGGLIAELKENIEKDTEELHLARKETEDFIESLEDTYTKTIFSLKFIACLSWDDTAEHIGFKGPTNSLRVYCYRILDSTEPNQNL